MSIFLTGLLIFLGIHSIRIIAPALRTAGVARLGEWPWKGVYSLVAIVGFVLMVMGWPEARATGISVWTPPSWTRHVTMLLMLPVFIMLLAAYLPGRIRATLKHPMLVATKLWAVAHLISNGQLHEMFLFGGFLFWAVLDRISVKRRPDATNPAPAKWNALDTVAVVAGLALYALFVGKAHAWLFGMPLMTRA